MEVSFEDIAEGKFIENASSPGVWKILKCAKEAEKVGLNYIWVDTCKNRCPELLSTTNHVQGCIIQTHHRRQHPAKGVAYTVENGGRTYLAFEYERIDIFYDLPFYLRIRLYKEIPELDPSYTG